MTERIAVLDHGYIELVESWGSDERIIEAARMSTGKGFLGWGPLCEKCGKSPTCAGCGGAGCIDGQAANPCKQCGGRGTFLLCDGNARHVLSKPGDEKLLRFLYENKHATPFEMAGLIIEVQAPIFVFREWHRHRTQSYNEMSARYTPLPDLNYIPTVERLMVNAGTPNKQAGTVNGSAELTLEAAERFRKAIAVGYDALEAGYQAALRDGIPKELARILLPVGRYSRMRASANLRNWLAFLTLRMAPNAQYEIRMYADAVGTLIADRFPRTWELFAERKATA